MNTRKLISPNIGKFYEATKFFIRSPEIGLYVPAKLFFKEKFFNRI